MPRTFMGVGQQGVGWMYLVWRDTLPDVEQPISFKPCPTYAHQTLGQPLARCNKTQTTVNARIQNVGVRFWTCARFWTRTFAFGHRRSLSDVRDMVDCKIAQKRVEHLRIFQINWR